MKMYLLLKLVVFHCYVSLPEGNNIYLQWIFWGFVGKWLGNVRITQVGGVLYKFSITKYISLPCFGAGDDFPGCDPFAHMSLHRRKQEKKHACFSPENQKSKMDPNLIFFPLGGVGSHHPLT